MENNPSANEGAARDVGSILGSRKALGVGSDTQVQYSSLEDPVDKGACWATVHRIAKSQT